MTEQRRRGGPLRRTTGTREQRTNEQRRELDYVQVLMNPGHFKAYHEWLTTRHLTVKELPFVGEEFPTYIITRTDDHPAIRALEDQ